MPALRRTPASEDKPRPKSSRKPLQPWNAPATPPPADIHPKLKTRHGQVEISLVVESNKENHHTLSNGTPVKIEQLDASLAEELIAVRKKLERLRLDRERTEKMLKERDAYLESMAKEIEERGEFQKVLENEVDRLYRLKQLRLSIAKASPIRSLRERQNDKKSGVEYQTQTSRSQETKSADGKESDRESDEEEEEQSSSSVSSTLCREEWILLAEHT